MKRTFYIFLTCLSIALPETLCAQTLYPIQWINVVGATVNADKSLTKTGTNGWTSGANSTNLLLAGIDGQVQFTYATSTGAYMVGLSRYDKDANYTSVEYGIALNNGVITVYESGTSKGSYGTAAAGDVFKVVRTSNTIHYFRNLTELGTGTVMPNTYNSTFFVDVSVYSLTMPVLQASFDAALNISSSVTPVVYGGVNGAISVSVTQGTAPYTYSWDSGETTNTINGKSMGTYKITVTDAQGRTASKSIFIGYRSSWIDATNGLSIGSDNSLTKTATTNAWDVGAVSSNILPANTDGWIEFTWTNAAYYQIGLSRRDLDGNYTSIEHGLFIYTNNDIYIYESGASQGTFGRAAVGDIFRIVKTGATISYFHNGYLLRSVNYATTDPSFMVDVSVYSPGTAVPKVFASFEPRIKLAKSVKPVKSLATGGDIEITPAGGTAPYTYSWNTGSTDSNIKNKPTGEYGVTVTDAEGRTASKQISLGYAIDWTNINSRLRLQSDNSFLKFGSAAWDAGASSINTLLPADNGWIEFELPATDLSIYDIGLSQVDLDQSYSGIQAGFISTNGGTMYVYQKDLVKANVGLCRKGDVYKIKRDGTNILFYQNGILTYTMSSMGGFPFVVDISVNQGAIPVVYSSFDTRLNVIPVMTPIGTVGNSGGISLNIDGGTPPYTVNWSTSETGIALSGKSRSSVAATVTDAVGRTTTHTYTLGDAAEWSNLSIMARESNYTLRKTGTTNASNAGAFSRNGAAANQDAVLEFVYQPLTCSYLLGLSSVNTTSSGADTEYGFNFGYGTGLVTIYEKSSQTPLGVYALAGDVFTIKREGLAIKYFINGVQVKTTTITTSKALYADVSVYSASGLVPAVIGSFTNTAAAVSIDQKIRNNWAFEYRYDERQRMIAKKAPGADWTYMVYDGRDRLVLTKDGNQQSTNEWVYTKYDVLNRPVMTGLYKHPGNEVTQAEMQQVVNTNFAAVANYYETYDGTSTNFGYTNVIFPTTSVTPLTVTYYDDYQFKALYNDPRFDFVSDHSDGQNPMAFDRVKGQVTGTRVRSLNDAYTWMRAVNYYDDKFRVIQHVEEDHQGKILRSTSLYDFVGKVDKSQSTIHQSFDVVWARFANTTLDNETNTLNYNGTQAFASGASSSQVLAATQDGWVESVYDGTSVAMLGLTDTDTDAGYNKILFCAYTTSLSKLYAYAIGTQTGFLGDIKKGDVIRVERIATKVYVKVNGDVRHSFPATSATPLIVDVSMTSGSINNARASFGADKSMANTLQWGYTNLVSTTGNTVTKTSTSAAWNASAGTLNVLSGPGWVQFKSLETTTARAAGLASSTPIAVPTQLDYGIYLKAGGLFDVVEGTQTIASGTYAVNDVFKIESTIENGQLVMTYTKTGGFSKRSTVVPTKAYRAQVVLLSKSATIGEVSVSFPVPLTEQKTELCSRFEYDHAGRLQKEWQKVNNEPEVLLTLNDYNELGQLITKKLYNTDPEETNDNARRFKQEVDYRYNIRGWLTRINNSDLTTLDNAAGPQDLFGMELSYEKPLDDITDNTQVAYNGNISAIRWSNNLALGGINNPTQRAYRYSYDPMNRLTSADHLEATGSGQTTDWDATNAYKESIMGTGGKSGYDLNGNILNLQRTGKDGASIDALTYSYGADLQRSNKLLSVTDAPNAYDSIRAKGFKDGTNTTLDYSYDPNGNMVSDLNKDVQSITYNHLNLPARVNKTSGEYVKYIYDATGRKLAQQVFDANNAMTKRSDYVGSLFLENDTLKFINHAEGRIIPAKAKTETNEYQYHLKDHLGNVRLTFTTKRETESSIATLEPDHEDEDRAKFLYYDEAVKVRHYWFDHTNNNSGVPEGVCTGFGTVDGYATRLTGGNTAAKFGLAQSISVMPGDTVNMEVWAKYVDLSQETPGAPIVNFITTLGSAASISTGTFIDGGAPGSLGDLPMLVNPIPHLTNDPGNTAPKAYLNFVFLDRDMQASSTDLGYSQITTDAIEHGQNGCHQKLSLSYPVKQPGYLYIYLSNENPTEVEVFFDDFKVEHVKSPVVQQDDYYPFGLTYNSYTRENSVKQDFLYNGKELQNELNLGWLDYGMRMYQPDLGRFFTQDRFAEKYYSLNPYQYGANNPLVFMDANGDSLIVSGPQSQVDDFKAVSNQGTGGFYNTQVGADGQVSLEPTQLVGPPSPEQAAFANLMSGVISDPNKVEVNLRGGTDDTLIGNFGLETIDMDDVQQFGDGPVATAQGALIHEVKEQQGKQSFGMTGGDGEIAHFMGVLSENQVNGSTRTSVIGALPSTNFKQDFFGVGTGNIDFGFVKNGESKTVSVIVKDNNIIKVKQ